MTYYTKIDEKRTWFKIQQKIMDGEMELSDIHMDKSEIENSGTVFGYFFYT